MCAGVFTHVNNVGGSRFEKHETGVFRPTDALKHYERIPTRRGGPRIRSNALQGFSPDEGWDLGRRSGTLKKFPSSGSASVIPITYN